MKYTFNDLISKMKYDNIDNRIKYYISSCFLYAKLISFYSCISIDEKNAFLQSIELLAIMAILL